MSEPKVGLEETCAQTSQGPGGEKHGGGAQKLSLSPVNASRGQNGDCSSSQQCMSKEPNALII